MATAAILKEAEAESARLQMELRALGFEPLVNNG